MRKPKPILAVGMPVISREEMSRVSDRITKIVNWEYHVLVYVGNYEELKFSVLNEEIEHCDFESLVDMVKTELGKLKIT